MKNSKLNKVFWVFNRLDFKIIPSYYVSGVLPSNYLNSPKLIFLEGHDPEQTLNNIDAKVLILFKAFDKGLLSLALAAKKSGLKIISVFDDWYFQNTERTKFNLPMAALSDLVIVKTLSASKEIKDNFQIESMVLPDPVRFSKKEVFKKNGKYLKLCWYGISDNHDTIINEIKNLEKINIPITLTILTNYIDVLKGKIDNLNILSPNIIYKYWHENADLDIIKSDIVLLPYPYDKKRLVKSSNRIVDALNLGRFTIMSPVSQFKEFQDYVYYGNISDGIKWFNKNEQIAKEKTLNGQKYVSENYSIEVIANKWKEQILKII